MKTRSSNEKVIGIFYSFVDDTSNNWYGTSNTRNTKDNKNLIFIKEKIMKAEKIELTDIVKCQEATRKIEVFYKLVENTKNGTKFKKWLTATKDGKIYQVKFVLGALSSVPSARATIYVKDEDMNWNYKNKNYPVLYVKNIQKVEQKESAPEDFDNYFEKA